MTKPTELKEEEFNELVNLIAKPVFKFIMRRINKEILSGDKYKSLDANHFFNVIVAAMASNDTNLLRWMQCFYKLKTNSEMDFEKLTFAFIHSLQEGLKTVTR
jgi:hypothetical protein